MRYLILVLALMTLAAGSVATWYWFRASRVRTEPLKPTLGKIEWSFTDQDRNEAIISAIKSINESGRLNAVAALWTGAAVILGCLATVAGVWPL